MASANISHQRLQESPCVLVVSIAGDVDEHSIERVEPAFDKLLQEEQPRHVLLDLSGLTFASTAFYSRLVFWQDEMVRRGGKLVLYGVPSLIASTIRMFSLDRVLSLQPDQAAALAALPRT